jgi:c(7)-type cytochrome triheme protein
LAAPAASGEEQDRLQRIKEKLKTLDPSMVIYLDSRGNIAGTGDPAGLVGRAELAGKDVHPPALELSGFPKDRYDLVDWASTIVQGKIKPRDAIDPSAPEVPPFDLDVVITTKSKFQPDVLFSHKVHTLWLGCENCHEKIFKRKIGGNPEMHMTKIAAGEYCGRCHDRVAFPLTDCLRCHVLAKDRPK